jgi:hypothetical protein
LPAASTAVRRPKSKSLPPMNVECERIASRIDLGDEDVGEVAGRAGAAEGSGGGRKVGRLGEADGRTRCRPRR